jgi:hypothetical protein
MVRTATSSLPKAILARHLLTAGVILERAELISGEPDLAYWREERRAWAQASAKTIAQVFDAEAVAEFAHAFATPTVDSGWREVAKTDLAATRKATELLRALRSTL